MSSTSISNADEGVSPSQKASTAEGLAQFVVKRRVRGARPNWNERFSVL